MRIEIHTQDFLLTLGLDAQVRRRLQFALSRFQNQVSRVTAHLSGSKDPGDGVDYHCHLQLRLHGLPDIVVKDTEANIHVAVDRAAQRAARTLGRHLLRARGSFDKHFEHSDDERIE